MSASVIKSAARTLDLLEFFSTTRRAASVSDVVKALDVPQSSASMLLKSLVTLGYLEYLSDSRTFRPTLRVSLLGDWISPALFDGRLTESLRELQRATEETVLLGRRQGSELQYVFSEQPANMVQLSLRPGLLRPMTRTALGRALLSQLPESAARRIIRRNNADAKSIHHRIDERRAIEDIREIRKSGVAESDGLRATPDALVIATVLPASSNVETLAVGVGGPYERVRRRREEVIATLKRWLATRVHAP